VKAKPLLDSNNVKELVDPSLGNEYDPEELVHTLAVASMCIHHSSSSRPSVNSVSNSSLSATWMCKMSKLTPDMLVVGGVFLEGRQGVT
jgi:hypothetical protein